MLFRVDERYRARDIEGILQVLGPIQTDAPRTEERLVLDSVDWRLYRRGGFVEEIRYGTGVRTVWRDRKSGEVVNMQPGPAPRFAHELPEGPLRNKLSDALDIRALLPSVRIRSRIRELRLLNSEGKTVVCVLLEQHTARSGGEGVSLGSALRIVSVKGYEKACQRVRTRLLKMGAGTPVQDTLIERALHVVGRHPENDDQPPVRLMADIPVSLAMAVILRDLFQIMEANEEGVISAMDTEFLHDYRIAVRSVRSLLGQIHCVFPPSIKQFRSEFAWLGSITTPVRDLDVFLLQFTDPSRFFPGQGRNLLPLRDFLNREQGKAQDVLRQQFESDRYQRLKREFRAFLDHPEVAEWPALAAKPVMEIASQRIWRGYKRVMRQGRAITGDSPPEALHELRKTCKKLRYLLDFFRSLYPAREMDALIKEVKRLQNNLGEYQDMFFQANALAGFRRRMAVSGELTNHVDRAIEAVLARRARGEVLVRKVFDRRFSRFSDAGNQKRFRRLFGHRSKRE